MNKQSIFILSSERSGSNLLRTLLGNHQDISAPTAPHFYDAFYKALFYYGSLGKKQNILKLISDMLQVANHPYTNWQLKNSPEEIYSRFQPKNFYQVFDAIYTVKMELEKKLHFVCKGNDMFNHLFHVLNNAECPKFLFLYRDPRDHVLSWLKTPLSMYTPIEVANRWDREQRTCISLMESHGVDMHQIKYENLITKPEYEISRVLEYLSLSVDDRCFQTDSRNIESRNNVFWKNLSKPIINSNQKKYLEGLSSSDLLTIETIARNSMEYLQYDFETSASFTNFGTYSFRIRNRLRRIKNKYRAKRLLKTEMENLSKKRILIKQIRTAIINRNF